MLVLLPIAQLQDQQQGDGMAQFGRDDGAVSVRRRSRTITSFCTGGYNWPGLDHGAPDPARLFNAAN